jgi:signal transduction histidine kinase
VTPVSDGSSSPPANGGIGETTIDQSRNDTRWKIAVIVGLVVVATALHYGIDVKAGAVHDVLTRSYYIPIVMAGLWFGPRGGLATSLCVSIVFFPHAFHGWQAPYTLIFRLIEILMYNVIGGLTGLMSSTPKRALASEKSERLGRERAYEDLKEKTELLLNMEEELRRSERLAALGRMSAGLAHEIRNPLATIKTSVEILQERDQTVNGPAEPSTSPDLLEVLLEETDRLNRILTEFLQFARAESTAEEDLHARCTVGDVLAGTMDLLRPKLDVADIKVSFDADSLDEEVALNEDHLRQILLNLFLNAIDAVPPGGEIRIHRMARTERHFTVAIDDTGPGISPEVVTSIFDPFFSTKEGGVGLGLSIVARLLDSNGGEIKLDQSRTSGTRFLVTIPK